MHSRAEILDVLAENLRSVVDDSPDGDISEQWSMSDYGADSLEIIEVVSRTLKQLGTKVPRTDLTSAGSIGDLVTLIEKSGFDAYR